MKCRCYVFVCSIFVATSGLLWGYEVSSVNGVKEMVGFRKTFNISYTHLLSDGDNGTELCSSSDDVETSALLGVIVTVLHIGCVIGALMAGPLSDFASRKVVFIIGVTLCSVGGAFQSGAMFLWMIFVGRITAGLGLGVVYQVAPLYIAELSPRELRGRLIALVNFFAVIGMILGFTINTIVVKYFYGWRISLGVYTLIATILALGMLPFPKTPRMLVKKGRYLKALKVLRRVHKDESRAEKELEEIKSSLHSSGKENLLDNLKYLFKWKIIHRVTLGFLLQLFARLGGSTLVIYYSVSIFCHVGVDGFVASMVLGGVVFCSQPVGIFLVDKVGRKPLLLLGALIQVFCLSSAATLILAFGLDEISEVGLEREQRVAGYFVVMFVVLFTATFGNTFGNVPFIVNSEIYPLQVRGIAVAISTTGWWIGNIILAELSPVLLSSPLETYGTFFLLAGVCVFCFCYFLFLLPETKGQSLEKVEMLFAKPWLERTNILYYLRCGCLCECCGYNRSPDDFSEDSEEVQLTLSESQSDSLDSLDSISSDPGNGKETYL